MADKEEDYYIPTVDKEGNLTGYEVRPLTQAEKQKKLDKPKNKRPSYSAPPKKKVKKASGGVILDRNYLKGR